MPKALIVLTSHSQMGETDEKTGFWLSELTHPYYAIVDRGIEVEIVSIQGGETPVDPRSWDEEDKRNVRFMATPELIDALKNSKSLDDIEPADYQAIIFAGGHGTMWDFPNDPDVQDAAAAIYEQGGIVAAICHGPAALINIKLSDGRLLIDDKRVTAFSNAEESAVQLTDIVPFSLQDELMIAGAHYVELPAWSANVVVDDRLVTGQNPQSAAGVGEAVCDLLLM
ncbi:type 1 glutamine amidotransferase domain-containing protein [Photobacterium sp. SDRW27]|uniref:type 1 glutamine amidotransferase domain-containing protein n=1 Tax=Photobacterium obscurum TaxID=2829490 RepID=UPI002243B9A7|nr:type 1 glutamine amidotransferase domain-containing protein [Photobacterium obscurum]MCW8327725.1 type 1 glutamine amidotransferase domain-containing protein [Photobacterium obscurum]